MRTLVVGAGLFGSVIARALRHYCQDEVLVVDCGKQFAGSGPAACLMKPSWFSSLGPDFYRPSLALLDELYGLRTIQFKVGLGNARAGVHWVPPADILCRDAAPFEVKSIERDAEGRQWVVREKVRDLPSEALLADRVVVAAGVWTHHLFERITVTPKWGAAFTWANRTLTPEIRPWAPYRQLVAFNRASDEAWVGDGSAWGSYDAESPKMKASQQRCSRMAGFVDVPKVLVGARPYHEEKPCLLREVQNNLWVATGGAKNGTIAAAWCAAVISRRVKKP